MTHTGEEKRKRGLIPQAERKGGPQPGFARLGSEKGWASAEVAEASVNEGKKSLASKPRP